HRPVGLLAQTLDREVGGAAVVRQRAGRLVALLLEGERQLGGLLGHVRQQLHVVELLDVVHRLVDAQRTQRGGRDHGEGEQRHQTGGDPPVAQGYSRTRAGGGLRGPGSRRGRARSTRGRGAAGARAIAAVTGAGRALVL